MNKVRQIHKDLEECIPLPRMARRIYTTHVKPLEDALAATKERERVLVETLGEALRSLEVASRELSYEHKLVLNGKQWGGTAIVQARAALASVKEPPS